MSTSKRSMFTKSAASGKSSKKSSRPLQVHQPPSTANETEHGSEYRIVKYEGSRHHQTVKLKKNALYHILGVTPEANQKEIKRAYRLKALALHPDKNIGKVGEDKEALNQQLGQVNRAYMILSDPTKRKIYDKYGIDAVQTFEDNEIGPTWLWFVYSSVGRVVTGLILLLSCCFCCFCCFDCCCGCFCGGCCGACRRRRPENDIDGYMAYDPERAQPEEPKQPRTRISSVINSISSKRILKKKKNQQPTQSAEPVVPLDDDDDGPIDIKIDSRGTQSKTQTNITVDSIHQSQQSQPNPNLAAGSTQEDVFESR